MAPEEMLVTKNNNNCHLFQTPSLEGANEETKDDIYNMMNSHVE